MRLNALAALMLDDRLAYEEQRKRAARDLDFRRELLDDEVKRRSDKLKQQRADAAPPSPINMELLAASAREILASHDVLGLFVQECSQQIAGEVTLMKLIYIAGTSRLFSKGMHLAIKGPSASGKSETRKTVLDYFPSEPVVSFTSLSERALIYSPDDFVHKILSMGEAHGREEADLQNYLLRELMSEGILRYHTVQKVGNAMQTIVIEKHGPVVFILTTTRNQLHEENETRMLSLETDDSPEQTARVIARVAVLEGLGRKLKHNYKPWQDYQRWLAAGEIRVRIPYAFILGRLISNSTSNQSYPPAA